MTDTQLESHVLALAGVFQAATLVQHVAREGSLDGEAFEAFEASIASLFKIDSSSTADVFGGRRRLARGLDTLANQLASARATQDAELTGYALSLLFLERKLARRRDLLQRIHSGITTAQSQVELYSVTHANVVARLADIYLHTVSTLSPRILVRGEPHYLNDPDNANRIRALLLAGIRAAVLWRQLGGNRLRLLIGRGRMVQCARDLLADATA